MTAILETLWILAVFGVLIIVAAGLLIWRGIDYLIED
jgi:hypothetical protein